MDKAKKKQVFYLLGKIILGMAIPFVISSIFLYLDGGQSIRKIMPSYNDEDFYFHQIKAILTYGQPLGYYGYDGSHALIGNFGFHGFIILVPYAVFGSLFGMKFYTMALTNIGLMAVCNLIYVLLYKPGYKRLFSFSILILSPMLLYFINTNMVEGENYFFAVISAMLMVRILQNGEKRTLKIALGVFIAWAILSKITWTILVFPYLLILLKNNRRLSGMFKGVLAGGVTVFSGAVGYAIFLLFRASYFKHLSLMELYAEYITTDGLWQGFSFIFEAVRKNMAITWLDSEPPWLTVCRVFIIVMGIFAVAFAILEHRENSLSFIPAYMVLGFIFGVAILYAGGREAVRTVYAGGVFAQAFMLTELLQVRRKKFKKVFTGVSVLFFILGFIIQATWGWGVYKRHYYDPNNQAYYQKLEQYMGLMEPQVDAANPWDNTLVLTLSSYPDRIYELFIPTGIGLNYYRYLPQDLSGFEAGYILLSNGNLEDKKRLRESGYFVLAEDENTTLLSRISRKEDIKGE